LGDLILPPGIRKLSELIIDVNKDWLGYIIKNLGTPVDPNDASRLTELTSHAALPSVHHTKTTAAGEIVSGIFNLARIPTITRAKLEYPTEDVTFTYLSAIGKLEMQTTEGKWMGSVFTTDSFADKAVRIQALCGTVDFARSCVIFARWSDFDNRYDLHLNEGATTEDTRLSKKTAGVETLLGYEAVDLTRQMFYTIMLSITGTTLDVYRTDMVTPKFSVTDTDHALGKWGFSAQRENAIFNELVAALLPPASSPPKVLAYFEVPVIGTGTPEDPYRAQMPESLTPDGKRNLLSMSHSSLIPTDPTTGKPIHGTALLRIFEQPDRDPTLRDIPTCLDALRAMTGVTELTRDDAISRARVLDDKLHLFDLVRVPTPVKDQIKEYIEWRRTVHKVEMPEEVTRRYLESDKGW